MRRRGRLRRERRKEGIEGNGAIEAIEAHGAIGKNGENGGNGPQDWTRARGGDGLPDPGRRARASMLAPRPPSPARGIPQDRASRRMQANFLPCGRRPDERARALNQPNAGFLPDPWPILPDPWPILRTTKTQDRGRRRFSPSRRQGRSRRPRHPVSSPCSYCAPFAALVRPQKRPPPFRPAMRDAGPARPTRPRGAPPPCGVRRFVFRPHSLQYTTKRSADAPQTPRKRPLFARGAKSQADDGSRRRNNAQAADRKPGEARQTKTASGAEGGRAGDRAGDGEKTEREQGRNQDEAKERPKGAGDLGGGKKRREGGSKARARSESRDRPNSRKRGKEETGAAQARGERKCAPRPQPVKGAEPR